ncbi:S8 family serine peptidase [Actinokineospora sp. 24-640]
MAAQSMAARGSAVQGSAVQGSAAPPAAETAVTLITGDQVVMRGETPFVRPAPGREGIGFSVRKAAGHLHVTPSDALPDLAAGRLDRRLFDVTGLVEAGDHEHDSIPLIVTAPTPGMATTSELPGLGLRGVAAEKARLDTVWPQILASSGKVWLDGIRKATIDHSAGQIGAPQAWAAGITGAGVTVAVLDTGVDQTHPDLASREAAERNFSDDETAVDEYGHGTHVASTIAGTGAKYRGVAPGARILDGKVLNSFGFGRESWILEGMRWAAEQGADIVNMSLGGGDSPGLDPLEMAVNTLSAEHGTLFVISAGNSGPGQGSVGSPGSAEAALTVGAVDRADQIAPFSSRGPLPDGEGIKPDITAPGVGIVAAQSTAAPPFEPAEPGYTRASGTSMAAPHVAGAAALLAQRHPDLSGARLKALLTASAKPTAGATAVEQGSGRVDVPRALAQTVTSEPTALSLGTQRWPHDDAAPVTKTLAYRNDGAADVRLDITAEGHAGMFTVSPAQVTVPAGGTAEVSVTADPRVTDQDGVYPGTVVATGGSAVARTPVMIEREVESYDVTFRALDPEGRPSSGFDAFIFGKSTTLVRYLYDTDGEITTRLPAGDYLTDSTQPGENRRDLLVFPALSVTGPTEVVFDARETRPIRFTPADPAAERKTVTAGYSIELGGETGLFSIAMAGEGEDLYTKHVGPSLPADTLVAGVGAHSARDGADYYLADFRTGTIFTGIERVVPLAELARARTRVDSIAPGRWGERLVDAVAPTGFLPLTLFTDRAPLPMTATEYFSPGLWRSGLLQYGSESGMDSEALLISPAKKFTAGSGHALRLNNPVFAPTVAGGGGLFRYGDEVIVDVAMAGDGSGNAGYSDHTAARTELFCDGTSLGEWADAGFGVFPGPSEPCAARLTATVERDFPTSTRVDAAWTFRLPGADTTTTPLSTIRLDANLRPDGTAPAGGAHLVPVALERSDGTKSRPRSLAAEVSYDDGRTWRPVTVVGKSLLALRHPDRATPVSLRLKAAGEPGETTELTVIRAYRLAKR